jgi:SAM-dependent methyltransferase
MQEDLAQVKDVWNSIDIGKVRDVAWSSIGYFGTRNASRISDKNVQEYIWDILKEGKSREEGKALRGCVLLCGDMAGESCFFSNPTDINFSEVDGFDISDVSLARVQESDFKFNGRVADCNDITLSANTYDLIVGSHGVHHVENLGGLFYQCHKSLKSSGLIYLNEWIGPNFLQIPIVNHLLSTSLLYLLYPKKKSRVTHEGRVKGLWLQYPPSAFDPSEACNAKDLIPQFLNYFDPVQTVYFGGLTYPIFEGLGHTIDENAISNKIRIRIIYYAERLFTWMGIIQPLFVITVAKKRDLAKRRRAGIAGLARLLKSMVWGEKILRKICPKHTKTH